MNAARNRLVLLASTSRVAAGLLTWQGWQELHAGLVFAGRSASSPQLPALAAAGVDVELVEDESPASVARMLRARAQPDRAAVWLAGPSGDPDLARELAQLAVSDPAVEIEVVYGSYDVPGARLLDLVALQDRLRSPGGCPWDAEQTHESLVQYLLEEAYETVDALETGDRAGLREELGDLLLQVIFHARVAEEHPDDPFSIDDIAGGIVDKLVRRHPHVFAPPAPEAVGEPQALLRSDAAAAVQATWDELKAAEKGRTSVTDGVPMGQPALSLAAALLRRAARIGVPLELMVGTTDGLPAAVAAAAAEAQERAGSIDALGDLLLTVVALARTNGIDPEAALRGAARRLRARLLAVESAAEGISGAPEWRELWRATAEIGELAEPAASSARAAAAELAAEDSLRDEVPEEALERLHEH